MNLHLWSYKVYSMTGEKERVEWENEVIEKLRDGDMGVVLIMYVTRPAMNQYFLALYRPATEFEKESVYLTMLSDDMAQHYLDIEALTQGGYP